MFTQFFIHFSNTKSYESCSALELLHADWLSYVPRGWERAGNRCVNSTFTSSRIISRWRASKNWHMSFPHESLKMVHGPLFFLAPNSTTHTYLLTLWYRVLLEQLTGLQLVKKFPAFHGTRRFITALTSVRHLSLTWASSIQSIYPHPTSWRSILILSTHLRLGLTSGIFPDNPHYTR